MRRPCLRSIYDFGVMLGTKARDALAGLRDIVVDVLRHI